MDINIDNYDLISFDIFDTLLLRAVSKPIEVFNHIWERAKKEEICMTDISPTEFMKLRVEMEHRARGKASGREVNLDEIYNELPNQIVTDVKRLKNLELVVEKECCYPNYTMYELVKSAKRLGKKVVLLSDMYLSKEQIIMILEHNKIDTAVFDGIFISNEMGCTKQDGGLYEILLNDWPQIEKTKILHIGDNENSDYVKAINAGIQAVHYDVIREKVQSIYDYEKIRHDTPQREILSLRKIASESVTFENQEEKALFEIGASIV